MSALGGSPTKSQFYSANGAGRDSYIYGNNGGFCPQQEACKIEALGKYPLNIISQVIRKAFLFAIHCLTLVLILGTFQFLK